MSSGVAVIVSIVLAVAGTLGAAWGVFQGSAKGKTLELYEKELDLRTEINERLEAENLRLHQRVVEISKEAARWQEAVTQKARVEELAKTIEREETARREFEKSIEMLLKDIVAQLKSQRGAIG
jgi:hypothetical protein